MQGQPSLSYARACEGRAVPTLRDPLIHQVIYCSASDRFDGRFGCAVLVRKEQGPVVVC
jgi:hypothetical protein